MDDSVTKKDFFTTIPFMVFMLNVLDIFSVGDLVDKLLINQIKIERIGGSFPRLESENRNIEEFISKTFGSFKHDLESLSSSLKEVLNRQWDALDISMEECSDDLKRGKFALLAQKINLERVQWKNEINKLCGSFCEVKTRKIAF